MNHIAVITEKINRLSSPLFLFVVLCGNILSFAVSSNEELHLQFARHYADPSWIANSVTLSDWPGYRFILNSLLGFLLHHMSFGATVFVGRLLAIVLLIIPLSRLFRLLQLTNIDALLLLQSFIFFGQSFYGGEWLFMSIEPKALAYPFVFLALYYVLKDAPFRAFFSLVVATYCHVLVGAWVFLLLFFYLLVTRERLAKTAAVSAVYLALVSPFFYYLLHELTANNQNVINGVDIDWVIVYYRSPHHFGPFLSPTFFFLNFLPGILFSVAAAMICAFVFRDHPDAVFKKANTLALTATLMILPFVLVAYFDTHGHIMKFHPYRLSSISLFLFLCVAVVYIRTRLLDQTFLPRYFLIVFLLSFTALGYTAMTNAGVMYYALTKPVRPIDELAAYVKTNTRTDDVFVLLSAEEDLDFARKADREVFAIKKFFPNTPKLIYAWYMRMMEQEKLMKDVHALPQTLGHYRIDYLVSKNVQHLSELEEVYKNSGFYLYKVRPQMTPPTSPPNNETQPALQK